MDTTTRRLVTTTAAATALLPLSLAALSAPAEAATRFANCTAMHRVYVHGVSKSAAAADKQVRDGYGRPAVRPAVYAVNAGSDRDKDGTACEA